MRQSQRMRSGMEHVLDNLGDPNAVFDLGEHEWSVAAHFPRVAFHNVQICAHRLGQVGFVDDQEIRLGNSGAAFARDFITTRHVDDLNGEIGQFTAEARGQVVAARFQ